MGHPCWAIEPSTSLVIYNGIITAMVKSKAHFDPRRDRPLATQSRGVAKRQQRREKHEEDEQAGAVAKAKKPKYGTVLFGPNPAVYSNLSSFKRAERAHPDARAYQSYQLRKIEAVIAQYKASLQPQVCRFPVSTTYLFAVSIRVNDVGSLWDKFGK